jgi:hypothetical protein
VPAGSSDAAAKMIGASARPLWQLAQSTDRPNTPPERTLEEDVLSPSQSFQLWVTANDLLLETEMVRGPRGREPPLCEEAITSKTCFSKY